MSDAAKYIVARREPNGYSTRGPVANGLTIADAAKAGEDLARQFPNQHFVILGEVAQVQRNSDITVQASTEEPAAPAAVAR
jgi:hypothetical protein